MGGYGSVSALGNKDLCGIFRSQFLGRNRPISMNISFAGPEDVLQAERELMVKDVVPRLT
jgi:hypothetical protein